MIDSVSYRNYSSLMSKVKSSIRVSIIIVAPNTIGISCNGWYRKDISLLYVIK